MMVSLRSTSTLATLLWRRFTWRSRRRCASGPASSPTRLGSCRFSVSSRRKAQEADMITTHQPAPVSPGEPAPDFALPAVDGTGMVSLVDYRGKSSVFLALFIGLWCPFCRRAIAQMSGTEPELKALVGEKLGGGGPPPDHRPALFNFSPRPLQRGADHRPVPAPPLGG